MPVISVGNLSMGGTGKTPHVEYLIRLLKDEYKVATLSRGFGRKERGFILADENATARQIGDEPMQYQRKFGKQIDVVVDANRVQGVMNLMYQKPDTQVVLLDDAYQHRAIHRGINILLTTESDPYFNDHIVPVGSLRESGRGASRADIIIVTKCLDLQNINKNYFNKKINVKSWQKVFFSRINYGGVYGLNKASDAIDLTGQKILLVTGIANDKSLADYLHTKAEIVDHFMFPDHHVFSPSEISEIHAKFDTFADDKPLIVTTEKDAMRLLCSEQTAAIAQYPWYYQEIEVELDNKNEFDQIIKKYVEANS